MSLTKKIGKLYWPDPEKFIDHIERERWRQRRVAFPIGLIAIFLAPAVWYVDRAYPPYCLRDSISHYFYEPRAGTILVMAMTIVAAFFYTYRGELPRDKVAAMLGCVAALTLAFFPTAKPGCTLSDTGAMIDLRGSVTVLLEGQEVNTEPGKDGEALYRFNLPDESGTEASAGDGPSTVIGLANDFSQRLHSLGAIGVFGVLLYFAGYAFVRTNSPGDVQDGKWVRLKIFRNSVYIICGLAMLGGALIIVFGGSESGFFHRQFSGVSLSFLWHLG